MDTKPPRVVVLAPDDDSGRDFLASFNNVGISVDYVLADIPARVVADGKGGNKLTEGTAGVAAALVGIVKDLLDKRKNGEKKLLITLACNTLSLGVFIDRTKKLLENRGFDYGKDYVFVLTTDELRKAYSQKPVEDKPLVLGTLPFMAKIIKYGQKTPVSLANAAGTADDKELWMAIGELSQELIWRVKATGSSDFSTAPTDRYQNIKSEQMLIERGAALFTQLKTAGVKTIVWACTELPIMHKKLVDSGRMSQIDSENEMTFVNPADLVASKIENQLGF